MDYSFQGWAALFVIVFVVWLCATNGAKRREVKKRRKEASELLSSPPTFDNPNSPSSAHWATDKLLKAAGLFTGKGWRVGYSQSGRPLHYGGPGHLLLVAPARTGKAVTVLVAALLEICKASRIIIDPKGELCAITHARAAQFSNVVAIDPFGLLKKIGVKGVKTVGLNPLAPLDRSGSLGADIDSITDGVFVNEAGGGENAAFFNDSAALLCSTGIRAYVKYEKNRKRVNLVAMREEICRDVFAFAKKYASCGDSVIEAELARYTSKLSPQSRSVDDIMSTFRTQTAFIAMDGIRESLMDNGFRMGDLKRKRMTVYIILPLDKLASCGKWFRLCIATALADLLKAGPGGLPVLAVIDEFFSIGPLKAFQTAMSQAAGAAGLQLWPVLQDLAQLQTMYPREGWRTFLSNTAVKMFFGGAMLDYETAELLSRMCGERETVTLSCSVREDRHRDYGGGLYDVDMSHGSGVGWRRLVQPHEVRRMDGSEMIVFCEGVGGPILAKRKPYWKDCTGYGRNPYYSNGGGMWKAIFG